jgi:plastocyanin
MRPWVGRHCPHQVTARGLRLPPALGALLLVAGLLAGCGGSSAGKSTGDSRWSMTNVGIVATKSGHPDALYIPNPIRVRVGKVVTWTNTDTDPHDVTADDGSFYSGPIGTDGSWKWKATKAGTYTYTCTLHPDMHGTIIVSPS